ncbi:MAG: epimerase [Moraxellaceae bacterium]|nr:MAG: epimerase [Moraxellaceae bacterium]
MDKTILVTGGAGFIGTNFVNLLYNEYPNCKILVLDALTYAGDVQHFPDAGLDSDRFEFWYGNVLDGGIVEHLVSRADYIFHFAAESHVTRSIFDNKHFFETDVLGTQSVCYAVSKHRKTVKLFVHISTSEVYGTALTETMDEDHPLNPLSPYASAKCGADRLVYSYWSTYQIPAVIIRPFNNYGPYQHLEKVIPRFITSCILGESLTVHGDGSAKRDFVHVDDHCRALDMVLHMDPKKLIGEVINIGSGVDIDIMAIAQLTKSIMKNNDSEIIQIGDRPGQVFRHTCDATKAKEILDWTPEITFTDGMKKTVEWYVNNRPSWDAQQWMRQIPIVNAEGKREYH